MSDLVEYLASFFSNWWALVSAGAFFGIDEVAKRHWPALKERLDAIPETTRRSFEVIAIALAILYSGFASWQEVHSALKSSQGLLTKAEGQRDAWNKLIMEPGGLNDQIQLLKGQLAAANAVVAAKPKEVIRYIPSERGTSPPTTELRDPDMIYQLGEPVASVIVARVFRDKGIVTFEQIKTEGKLNLQQPFEYRDYVLRYMRFDAEGDVTIAGQRRVQWVNVICNIVGKRQ
jgi:hypothetical protein